MTKAITRVAILAVVLLASLPAGAGAQAAPAAAARSSEGVFPQPVVTRHSGRFNGRQVAYDAVAGDTILQTADDTPAATIFSVSYLERGADPAARPVVFVFNGGPGASSAWLHMGALGPKRARVPAPGAPSSGPYATVDNDTTPFDLADLVFVDPVGTGYSRLLAGGKPEDFYGNDADATSIARFIQQWLAAHGRWTSPKFMIGESYGTLRAVLVARKLGGGVQVGHFPAVSMNGIVLLGQVLSGTGSDNAVDDTGFATLLPGYAATAWHYGLATDPAPTLAAQVERAATFAREVYLPALYAGTTLPPARRAELAARLAALTGVPAPEFERRRLRLGAGEFAELLLRDRGRTLGRYDTRFYAGRTGAPRDDVGDDASMIQTGPSIAMPLLEYLRDDLNLRTDQRYELITWEVGHQWRRSYGDALADHVAELAALAQQNPGLHTFVGAGDFDLVTPAGAAAHMLDHAGLPAERTEFHRYPAGHMLYYGDAPLRAFHADLHRFLERALAR